MRTKMLSLRVIFLVLCLLLPLGRAVPTATAQGPGTEVSGLINSDTTWALSSSPYVVTGNVLVISGVTLTIEAGVTVKFASATSLQVNGTLIARGTNGNEITFTSNQASPSSGDWGYVYLADSSSDATYDGSGDYSAGSILEYCVVEYAGGIGYGAVRLSGAHPFLNHCTMRANANAGIYGTGLLGTLKVLNSTITESSDRGIEVSGGTILISNNTIHSNSGGGVYIPPGTTTITLSSNTVRDNVASQGGSIFVPYQQHGTITISDNTITNNTSSGTGGGIHCGSYHHTVQISGNTISHNTASASGGGVYSNEGNLTFEDNIISNNEAASSTGTGGGCPHCPWSTGGGGVFLYNYSDNLTVSRNLIVDNTLSNGDGSGVYYQRGQSGSVSITNNIISGNSGGDGINSDPGCTITGNAITNNTGWGVSSSPRMEQHGKTRSLTTRAAVLHPPPQLPTTTSVTPITNSTILVLTTWMQRATGGELQ